LGKHARGQFLKVGTVPREKREKKKKRRERREKREREDKDISGAF
jgi:hypothetical protein